MRLLAVLARSELTVTELTRVLGQSQPRVSRHLKLLCDAGLVERVPEGSWVLYRLANPPQDGPRARLLAAIVESIPPADPTVQRDLERLTQVRRARAEAAAEYMRRAADETGRIRSLQLPEEEIEAAMSAMVGEGPFEFFLDLGTGSGRILELLGNRAAAAEGIDLSHDMLTLARANLDRAGRRNCRVRQGDILSLPFPPGNADLVTLHQVLHFLADPAGAVAEAARVLAPGGQLLVVDFAPHTQEFLRTDHAHRRLGFAEGEVRGWFRANGLSLEAVRRLPETGDAPLTVCLWLGRRAQRGVRPIPLTKVAE